MISTGISLSSSTRHSQVDHLSNCLNLLKGAFDRAQSGAQNFPQSPLQDDLLAMRNAGNDQSAFNTAYSRAWASAILTSNIDMVRAVEFIDSFRGVIREKHPQADLNIH